MVSPSFMDISSVAKDSNAASGTMAKKLSTKTAVGFHPIAPEMMPSGTKTSSTLT
jgi:hypothetical protein